MSATAASVGPREQWRSRLGFYLATLGAAVGLGNIWRFSYTAGENGGGAFLIVYVVFVAMIGLPVLLAELAIGRAARTDFAAALPKLGARAPWQAIGGVAVCAAFVVLGYYAVIAGWAMKYLAGYASGAMSAVPAAGVEAHFQSFLADSVAVVGWQFGFLALTALVVTAGVVRGIELANTVLMPLLALVVIGLAAYASTLEGARAGLAFLFAPDWAALARPSVYLAALAQTLFSVGVGFGVLATYGSYLDERTAPASSGVGIAIGDTAFALIAGMAIFPAVFAFGLDPRAGPALAFVALPQVFASMSWGMLFAAGFFFLLTAAALTSAVSMLEVVVAYVMRRWRLERTQAVTAVALAAFVTGLPSALGFGAWSALRPLGVPILEAIDRFASELLLPLGAIGVAVFTGWTWSRAAALAAAGLAPGRIGRLWLFSLRYVAPGLIAAAGLAALL